MSPIVAFEEWWERNGYDYVTTKNLARDAWLASAHLNAAPQEKGRMDDSTTALSVASPAVAAPVFDAVQLSEARYYRSSKEPIGILARAILRANGEMK